MYIFPQEPKKNAATKEHTKRMKILEFLSQAAPLNQSKANRAWLQTCSAHCMLSTLLHLTRCSGCRSQSPDSRSFPLCKNCHESLILAPIHSNWIPPLEPLASLQFLYLLYGHGYTVLKRWKAHRGPVFDHRVLKMDEERILQLKSLNLSTLVPIPQNPGRLWKTESQTEVIALWLSQILQIPITHALQYNLPRHQKKQAELDSLARQAQSIPFLIRESAQSLRQQRVLLVDDFFTTGHTLRSAALALRKTQTLEIHGFCLGVRIWNSHGKT